MIQRRSAMNQYTYLVVVLAVALIFWKLFKRYGPSAKTMISPAEAKNRLDTEKGITLLDVRTKEEYLRKHIPNSTLMPLNVLEKEAARRLKDKDAVIFVYCASGSRSSVGVKILTRLGYTNVFNLGGLARWPYKTVSGNK